MPMLCLPFERWDGAPRAVIPKKHPPLSRGAGSLLSLAKTRSIAFPLRTAYTPKCALFASSLTPRPSRLFLPVTRKMTQT